VNSKRSRINDLRRDTRAVAGDPNRHFLHRNQTDPEYDAKTDTVSAVGVDGLIYGRQANIL